MKKALVILCASIALLVSACGEKSNAAAPKKGERKVAVQTYSMRNYTLEDSIALLSKLPVRAIEAWNGQKISSKYPNVKFDHKMNAEQRKFIKDLVSKNGFKIISMGVLGGKSISTDEEIMKNFEFAKYFDIPVVTIEPLSKDHLKTLDKYAKQYGLTLAIHNHQRGSGNDFYDPNVVMDYIKAYPEIGACPDNGAWSRSGLDPVKCFKIMEGKITLVHLKDQEKFNDLSSLATAYGKGVLDMKAMLAELDRQGYNGYLVIEHGNDSDKIMPIIEHDVKFLSEN